jgi:serine/threonine protein phosphatase PrpC
MRTEVFAASRMQEGKTRNEDAFLIIRDPIPCAVLCDGAGNADSAAKRAIALFEKLLKDATIEQMGSPGSWAKWVKLLDSSLLGGSQTTFVAAAIVSGVVFGVGCGDSRAYWIGPEGECRILTEGASKQLLGSGRAQAFFFRQDVKHSILLLMSDGAWTPLGGLYDLKMNVLRAANKHFSEAPESLLSVAGRAGRADDMTVVGLKIGGIRKRL